MDARYGVTIHPSTRRTPDRSPAGTAPRCPRALPTREMPPCRAIAVVLPTPRDDPRDPLRGHESDHPRTASHQAIRPSS